MEKITPKNIKVALLEHAPWNPRNEAELAWDNPAMVELIESVRATGVAQSLAVWDREDGSELLVIAGNRRLEAARAVGLDTVPALIFTGIDEARAHEITRAENEIRRGIDPLQDALLIERMMSKGLDQKTIAAHFAMSEAMVCRRAKLIGLDDSIRQIAAEFSNVATDALEQMALYPVDVQRACASSVKRYAKTSSIVRWRDVKWSFSGFMQSLDDAEFDTSACVSCPQRTGAQPDLWDEIPESGSLGECLCKSCYAAKVKDIETRLIREIVGEKVEVIEADETGYFAWRLKDRAEFGATRSKSRPAAWVWINEYRKLSDPDRFEILYGPTLADFKAILDREEKEREAHAAEDEAASEAERAERERLEAERRALTDAVSAPAEDIYRAYEAVSQEKAAAMLKKNIAATALKGAAAQAVGEFLADCMLYAENDDVIKVIVSVPGLAKALKISDETVKAYKAATKALADFDAQNKK